MKRLQIDLEIGWPDTRSIVLACVCVLACACLRVLACACARAHACGCACALPIGVCSFPFGSEFLLELSREGVRLALSAHLPLYPPRIAPFRPPPPRSSLTPLAPSSMAVAGLGIGALEGRLLAVMVSPVLTY